MNKSLASAVTFSSKVYYRMEQLDLYQTDLHSKGHNCKALTKIWILLMRCCETGDFWLKTHSLNFIAFTCGWGFPVYKTTSFGEYVFTTLWNQEEAFCSDNILFMEVQTRLEFQIRSLVHFFQSLYPPSLLWERAAPNLYCPQTILSAWISHSTIPCLRLYLNLCLPSPKMLTRHQT